MQRKAETYFQHTDSTFSSDAHQSMKRRVIAKHLKEPNGTLVFDQLLVILNRFNLSDVSYSDECRTKKYFQYAENMIPLFFAILKFCTTKHLFNDIITKLLYYKVAYKIISINIAPQGYAGNGDDICDFYSWHIPLVYALKCFMQ